MVIAQPRRGPRKQVRGPSGRVGKVLQPERRLLRLIAAPIMGRAIPIGAAAPVAVVIIPVVVVRPMEALQGKAIPEAPGLGRLRCRDANQQGDGGKGAKNESHRVTSFPNLGKETTR